MESMENPLRSLEYEIDVALERSEHRTAKINSRSTIFIAVFSVGTLVSIFLLGLDESLERWVGPLTAVGLAAVTLTLAVTSLTLFRSSRTIARETAYLESKHLHIQRDSD